MALGFTVTPFARQKILLAHSNVGDTMLRWHERRRRAAVALGYELSVFDMSDFHPYIIFPRLDKLWRRRDAALMRLYDGLGEAIAACDVFIHYNGALIHPEFLEQFNQLTIYHCADDPDASAVLSRPVARHYDMCAISNVACIEMYKSWGCENTFFWPIGSYSYIEGEASVDVAPRERDIPLVFIGSKLGATNVRYIGRYLGLYRKKAFMNKIERAFPELTAYGSGWSRGWLDDDAIQGVYKRARIGFNVHNGLGPINGRLYDLAAFGVCQICDNKANLSLVFDEGREILGFNTVDECIDLIRYYSEHPAEADAIAQAGRQRFLRDYQMGPIWTEFFANVNRVRRVLPRFRGQLS